MFLGTSNKPRSYEGKPHGILDLYIGSAL